MFIHVILFAMVLIYNPVNHCWCFCTCLQIQLVQPGQIQLQGGQTLQLQGQQGQPQQIIIQQPQTAMTAGQNQVLNLEKIKKAKTQASYWKAIE